jgi:hypothetical protein
MMVLRLLVENDNRSRPGDAFLYGTGRISIDVRNKKGEKENTHVITRERDVDTPYVRGVRIMIVIVK